MAEKRVIEQVASNEVHNDDWFLKDSPTQDTSKISATNLKAILGADGTLALEEIANAIAEDYNSASTYNTGDYAFYGNVLYRCKSDSVTGTWDGAKWDEINIPDALNGLEEEIAEAGKVDDVKVDGTSVVTNKVAEIEIPVKDVQVKTDSTFDSVVDASGNAKIDISGKADTSGYYEDFMAGTAENLMADNYTEDKVPYNFRQSFNGARLEDEIVGGTVAWNQQLSLSNLPYDSALYSNTTYTVNGVTFTKNNDGSITIQTESGGATSEASVKIGNDARLEFIKSHIHYIPRCKGGSASTYYFNYAGSRYVYDNDKIFAKQPSGFNMWLTVKQGTVITTPVKVYPQVVDLEQMFGTTIADAVYTMEEAEAGSGIAWLKSYGFLTKSYYAYNAGTLMSVNASSHDTVGKNLFDEANPDKWIFADGNLTDDVGSMTSQLIKAKEGQTYILSSANSTSTLCICFYDSEMNLLNRTAMQSVGQISATAPSNSVYMYASSFRSHNNLQLEFGATPTAYEPYTKHIYLLDSDLTLRGIPKLDANNKLYYDGDVYESDGSVTRRFGVVDLGTLSWTYYSGAFYTTVTGIKHGTGFKELMTIKYVTDDSVASMGDVSNWSDKTIRGNSASAEYIYIKDSAYSDAPTFKTAMSGVYLVYELATPTTESADAFATPQIVNPKGTEEYVDYAESQGTRDVAIPVGHNSKYYADLKAKIEDIPDVPSTNGTYTLKATRSASGVAYSWVSG